MLKIDFIEALDYNDQSIVQTSICLLVNTLSRFADLMNKLLRCVDVFQWDVDLDGTAKLTMFAVIL